MALLETVVGERKAAANVQADARGGSFSEIIVNDVGLGRYFESARLGRVFTMSTTAAGFSVANATFAAPIAATSTPIIGIFNPSGNGKAFVVLRSSIGILPAGPATTTVEPVWVGATPNAGITATAANATAVSTRFDGAAATTAKGYANTALTGLVNGVALGPYGANVAGTTGALTTTALITDETAGLYVVPPGAFIGVLATTTPVAATANGNITYAEIEWPL